MRNLKRLVSLGLSLCLALSLMCVAVPGASAAETAYTYGSAVFTDADGITQTEAVNTLVALDIIQGMDTGAFEPDRVVTRAEMAKMIYVMYNGGVDDGGNAWVSMSCPLEDISGHWAEGYIKGCYGAGIIAGVSATEFDPDSPVTTLQVYKMCLVLVGYHADRAGLVGAGLDVNTSRLATVTGLTENVTSGVNEGMPRQFAAQALYNCIDSYRVIYEGGEYVEMDKGDFEATVGEKYMGLYTEEGVLVANEDFSIDPDYVTTATDGYVKVTLLDFQSTGGARLSNTISIRYDDLDVSYDLMGMQVKVHYKQDGNNTNRYTMFGIYPSAGCQVEDELTRVDDYDVDDLTGDKNAEKNATVFVDFKRYEDAGGNKIPLDTAADNLPAAYSMRLIYNEDVEVNGGQDYRSFAFITATGLNKVLTLTDEDVVFAGSVLTGFEAKSGTTQEMEWEDSFDLTDRDYIFDIDENVDEGDMVWVDYNIASDKLTITPAAAVSGALQGSRYDNGELKDVWTADGKYKFCDVSEWNNYVTNSDFTKPGSLKLDNEYDFYILNDFAIAAEKTGGNGGGDDDYAILLDAYQVAEELRLKILRADGVTRTYVVDEFLDVDVDDLTSSQIANLVEGAGLKSHVTFLSYEFSSNGIDVLGIDNVAPATMTLLGTNLGVGNNTATNHQYLIEDLELDHDTIAKPSTNAGDFYKKSNGVVYGQDETASGNRLSLAIDEDATIFFQDANVQEDGSRAPDWDAYTLDNMSDDISWSELYLDESAADAGDATVVRYILNSDGDICLLVVENAGEVPSSSSDVIYGYVTQEPHQEKIDGTTYTLYTIWTKDGLDTYYEETSHTNILQHHVVAFCLDDDEIDSIYTIAGRNSGAWVGGTSNRDYKEFTNGAYSYCIGSIVNATGDRVKIADYTWNHTQKVDTSANPGNTYVTTSETVYLYIDSDGKSGRESGSVKEISNGTLNCVYVANEDGELEMILVDKANKFIEKFLNRNADSLGTTTTGTETPKGGTVVSSSVDTKLLTVTAQIAAPSDATTEITALIDALEAEGLTVTSWDSISKTGGEYSIMVRDDTWTTRYYVGTATTVVYVTVDGKTSAVKSDDQYNGSTTIAAGELSGAGTGYVYKLSQDTAWRYVTYSTELTSNSLNSVGLEIKTGYVKVELPDGTETYAQAGADYDIPKDYQGEGYTVTVGSKTVTPKDGTIAAEDMKGDVKIAATQTSSE